MDWLNALGMLALIAGHTELLVTLVNRTHGFPIHMNPLRHFRHVDDILIPAFPVAFLISQGLLGTQLLYGGRWSELPMRWCLYLVPCGLGFLGLVFSAVRYQRYRPPRHQRRTESRVVDVAQCLGSRPVAPGPFRFLTAVPFNEIFQLEINEKELICSRLPAEWDGLTIGHLTDLHFSGTIDRPFFEYVCQALDDLNADLLAFTGDLLDRQDLVSWFPDTLGRLQAPLGRFFILGNHDWDLQPAPIRRALIELGWQDLSSRAIGLPHRGRVLALGGSERPWMGSQPPLSTVAEADFRIFLSHTPDNFDWARAQGVDLMLSGHNHGGQVVLPLIGPVYSPSKHGVRYAGGTYWKAPTLLHVCRGISGRHPLRWRCRPELTRIVLRCQPTGVAD